ncbi:inner membrane protein ybjJ [Escherichia coli KTE57]|nr:inner membrane protein ybjJ [Escherichia coli KTE57]
MASWTTRTPAIRDILSVSIAEMGGVLFGLSIGSMSGILCSAWLVKRFGTRNVILVTMSCALIGMMILSLALWLTSPLLFAVGLKWSTKTGHRVRVFSSIDFPIRLVVTHHYIRAVLVRCNIQRYSPLLRELHR